MEPPLGELIQSYKANAPLEEAFTIPAAWYLDRRIYDLERRTVFARNWQIVGRLAEVQRPGQYLSLDLAGEPVVVVRGSDGVLRGFFNVCRHHAAVILTKSAGEATHLRCPYHGWTYSLEGELIGTPDFAGVCNFDRASNALVPVEADIWEDWVFVKLESGGPRLEALLGPALVQQFRSLNLRKFQWVDRRRYTLGCNWKVFVDNYLDGGYHVPHLHKGLASVLDMHDYTIELGERFCLQWSPMSKEHGEPQTSAVRSGERALYYWIYPNLMINCYEGAMDINTVLPLDVDRTEVFFDFYFTDTPPEARESHSASIEVSERIQNEDASICAFVQRGLASRSYNAGRLSVRREAGVHLFHRLLYADLAKEM